MKPAHDWTDSGNIAAVRPLRNGVISDFGVTLDMLRLFIKKWAGEQRFHNMRMVVCVPSGVTEVEKRAVWTPRGK